MYNNKRSVMGKWKRILIVAALTASVILALPVWGVGSAEAAPSESGKLNLEPKSCTLKVERAATTQEGVVIVDLYKVADAVKEDGYEAYHLKATGSYTGIQDILDGMKVKINNGVVEPVNNENGVNEIYRKLAQTVAKTALATKDGELVNKPSKDMSKPISGKSLAEFKELDPGMYLVVAHGDMKPEQYIREMNAADDILGDKEAPDYYYEGDDGSQIVTVATSGGYVYTYLPELISLPARVDEGGYVLGGSFSTADTENAWESTVTATLKSEQSKELTSLRIIKEFNNVSDDDVVKEDGFVFRYEVWQDEIFLFSDVETIYYGKSNTCETMKKIPVGATVKVKEIYSGAAFRPGMTEEMEANIEDGVYVITFNNTYTGNNTGGNVINNRFTYDGSDGWNPEQDPLKNLDNSLVSSGQTGQ